MKTLVLLETCFLLFFSFYILANGSHIPVPHLCDASGESSEECTQRNELPQPLRWWWSSKPRPKADIKFRLYKSLYEYTELENSSNIIEATSFLPTQRSHNDERVQWKFLIPGFPLLNNKSPFPHNVIKAYFERMSYFENEKHNILVVDWNQAACVTPEEIDFGSDSTYTEEVGSKLGQVLIDLHENQVLNLSSDVHLIGFSLGAHVAGEAARTVFKKYANKYLTYRLTALDPANRQFWSNETGVLDPTKPAPFRRAPAIRRGYVAFLDAYHTSKDYGINGLLGDIDFYPNNGTLQEGCDIKTKKFSSTICISGKCIEGKTWVDNYPQLCSHMYSTELFARSINDRSILACIGCDYWDLFVKKDINQRCRCEEQVILGEDVDKVKDEEDGFPLATGIAFMKPSSLGDFGKRFLHNLEDHGEPKNGHLGWRQLCN